MRKPLESCRLNQNNNIEMNHREMGCEAVVTTQRAKLMRSYEQENWGSTKTRFL